jgi:hypothetical protein
MRRRHREQLGTNCIALWMQQAPFGKSRKKKYFLKKVSSG